MKKNNDNKKIKTETNNFFSLSLFVNPESCCVAWGEQIRRRRESEGAVRRPDRRGGGGGAGAGDKEDIVTKKIRPETYKK